MDTTTSADYKRYQYNQLSSLPFSPATLVRQYLVFILSELYMPYGML